MSDVLKNDAVSDGGKTSGKRKQYAIAIAHKPSTAAPARSPSCFAVARCRLARLTRTPAARPTRICREKVMTLDDEPFYDGPSNA
jgi:hypothetical protein